MWLMFDLRFFPQKIGSPQVWAEAILSGDSIAFNYRFVNSPAKQNMFLKLRSQKTLMCIYWLLNISNFF